MQTGFFNQEQRLNRDLTILFLNALKPKLFLDGFGATGIRGIRVSLETDTQAVISERSEKSYKILEKNVISNESGAEIHWSSFEEMVTRYEFDFIDVDPYGSIIPYLDISLDNVRNRGYIGFTATDLSPLSGALPEKTFRRYGSVIPKSTMRHELGIRNLIGTIARRAASLDCGIEPLLSFWHKHYYRVFVKITRGASKADDTLRNVGLLNLEELLGNGYNGISAGPIWKGKIENFFDEQYIDSGGKSQATDASMNFLNSLKFEDTSVLFCDLGEIFSRNHKNIPSIKKAQDMAIKNGIKVINRTHFSPTGLKMNNLRRFCDLASGEF
ncbi:MAG: class I SAM-dependent methyltransferase [Thermoplasmataceae archaeon]